MNEQHKGQVADLVEEIKEWKESPRCYCLDSEGFRYKDATGHCAIGTVKDEPIEDKKRKKTFLDKQFGELVRNEQIEPELFTWVYPPFAFLVLDTITYGRGQENVKYYKVLANNEQVWIHSKDICLL